MKKEERYKKVIDYFSESMPVAETELDYRDPVCSMHRQAGQYNYSPFLQTIS